MDSSIRTSALIVPRHVQAHTCTRLSFPTNASMASAAAAGVLPRPLTASAPTPRLLGGWLVIVHSCSLSTENPYGQSLQLTGLQKVGRLWYNSHSRDPSGIRLKQMSAETTPLFRFPPTPQSPYSISFLACSWEQCLLKHKNPCLSLCFQKY